MKFVKAVLEFALFCEVAVMLVHCLHVRLSPSCFKRSHYHFRTNGRLPRMFASTTLSTTNGEELDILKLNFSELRELLKRLGGTPGNKRKAELFDSCKTLLSEGAYPQATSVVELLTKKIDQEENTPSSLTNTGPVVVDGNRDLSQDFHDGRMTLQNRTNITEGVENGYKELDEQKPVSPRVRTLQPMPVESESPEESVENVTVLSGPDKKYEFPVGPLRDTRLAPITESGEVHLFIPF